MIPTRDVLIEGIGRFAVPCDTPTHSEDGEHCVRSVCGRLDPELARANGEWGVRVGQEYSYRREATEDVQSVLDIGHNVGAFAVWACRVWWPDSVERIDMFDPNAGCTDIARWNRHYLIQKGISVLIHPYAVTTSPEPTFVEDENWGCSTTTPEKQYIENRRVVERRSVLAIHPRDLPPADAVKIDAEGVEGEILEHYPHWRGVKVLMLEWHNQHDRALMHELARFHMWRLAKNDCGDADQGVAVWVRP